MTPPFPAVKLEVSRRRSIRAAIVDRSCRLFSMLLPLEGERSVMAKERILATNVLHSRVRILCRKGGQIELD